MNPLVSCPNCGFLQKVFKTMQDNEFITCIKCSYKWIILDQNSLTKSNIKFVLNNSVNNSTTTIDNIHFVKKSKPEAVVRPNTLKPNNVAIKTNNTNTNLGINVNNNQAQQPFKPTSKPNDYLNNSNSFSKQIDGYKNNSLGNDYLNKTNNNLSNNIKADVNTTNYVNEKPTIVNQPKKANTASSNVNAGVGGKYNASTSNNNLQTQNYVNKKVELSINKENVEAYINKAKQNPKANSFKTEPTKDLAQEQVNTQSNILKTETPKAKETFKSSINLDYGKEKAKKFKDFNINDIKIKEEIDVDNLLSFKEIKEKNKQLQEKEANKLENNVSIANNKKNSATNTAKAQLDKIDEDLNKTKEKNTETKKDKIKEVLDKLDEEVDLFVDNKKVNKKREIDEEDDIAVNNKNFFDEAEQDLEISKKYSLWSEIVNKFEELNKPQNLLKLFVYSVLILFAIFLFKNNKTNEEQLVVNSTKEIPLKASINEQMQEDSIITDSNYLGSKRAGSSLANNNGSIIEKENEKKEVILLDSDKILNNQNEFLSNNSLKAQPTEVKNNYFNGLYLSLKTKTANLLNDLVVVKSSIKFKSSFLEKHLEATILIKNSSSKAYNIKVIEVVFVDQANKTIASKKVPINQFIDGNQSINLILKLPDAPFNTFGVYAFIDDKSVIN